MTLATQLLTEFKARAWIAAILLFFALIFRNALQAALTNGVNAIGKFVYERLAGSRLLRRKALARYRDTLRAHCSKINVPFRPNRPLPLDNIYVDLRITEDGSDRPIQTSDAVRQHKRIVVKGPPGAGKSMFLRHTASTYLLSRTRRGFTEPVPVLLELHRLGGVSDKETLIEDQLVSAFERSGFPRARKFVRAGLDKGSLLLLLDGLDEIPKDDRGRIVKRLTELLERYETCPAIITCRTAVYRGEFDSITERAFEIEPFRDQQIQSFLRSWPEPMPAGKSPGMLMAVLRGQPKLLSAARNPLLLTIMAHLYSDIPTYMLPRSRADFYRQASAILLDQWQGQLNQNVYEAAEKDQVLRYFSLRMLELGADARQDRRTLTREQAIATAAEVMPRLGRDIQHVEPILREIVERSGLLLKIDGGQRYAFAHLTFQEYFAAEGLLERPNELLARFTSDPDSWREVVKLWCGLATDCTIFVANINQCNAATALECVSEARALEQDVADSVLTPATVALLAGDADDMTQHALAAVAADVRPRGDMMLSRLITALNDAAEPRSRLAIANALSASNRPAAAEALVSQLHADPRLKKPIIALGDLAVEVLTRTARQNGRVDAVECLGEIGTPTAARELVPIILDRPDSPLARPAACYITGLVGNLRVQQEIAQLNIPEQLRQTQESLDWIWAPFTQDSTIRWVVGRAAALVRDTEEPLVCRPDPIVSTAIAALDSRPLAARFDKHPPSSRLVSAVNNIAGRDILDFDGTVLRMSRFSRARVSESPLARRFVENDDLADYRELIQVMANESVFPLDALAPRAQPIDEFVEALLDSLALWPQWVALIRALPTRLRATVLFRFAAEYRFRPDVWFAVAQRVPFRMERSLRYAVVLFIAAALSVVAVGQGTSMLVEAGFHSVTAWLIALGCFSVVGTWISLVLMSKPSTAYGRIDSPIFVLACLGPIAVPVLLIDSASSTSVDELVIFVTIGFAPTACWLVPLAGARAFPLAVVIPAFVLVVLAAVALVSSGERRERATRSPLMGLFVERISAD